VRGTAPSPSRSAAAKKETLARRPPAVKAVTMIVCSLSPVRSPFRWSREPCGRFATSRAVTKKSAPTTESPGGICASMTILLIPTRYASLGFRQRHREPTVVAAVPARRLDGGTRPRRRLRTDQKAAQADQEGGEHHEARHWGDRPYFEITSDSPSGGASWCFAPS